MSRHRLLGEVIKLCQSAKLFEAGDRVDIVPRHHPPIRFLRETDRAEKVIGILEIPVLHGRLGAGPVVGNVGDRRPILVECPTGKQEEEDHGRKKGKAFHFLFPQKLNHGMATRCYYHPDVLDDKSQDEVPS